MPLLGKSKGIYREFQKLIPAFNIRNKKVIVPWGVPKSVFKVKDLSTRSEKWKLIYAGRLTKNKGVDLVLQALTHLPEKFKLTIVGEGEEEHRLKKLIEQLKLKSRVDFLPFKARNVLWEIFDKHHALIIPSKKIEAFGMVAIEAQARGLPVIHSSLSSLNEILKKGGGKFKVNCSNDLVNTIKDVFKDKVSYENESINAFSNARNFLIKKTINQIEEISQDSIVSFHDEKIKNLSQLSSY